MHQFAHRLLVNTRGLELNPASQQYLWVFEHVKAHGDAG
jgi:hypothetical protein